jgi:hypothetical protein
MADLGDPTSYLELPDGVPVFASDGDQVGTLSRVVADAGADIFDGLVFSTGILGTGERYVHATEVDGLYVGGVVLTLDAAAAAELPEPPGNAA